MMFLGRHIAATEHEDGEPLKLPEAPGLCIEWVHCMSHGRTAVLGQFQ